MIRFNRVRGQVWIDDRAGKETRSATLGMTMPSHGADCIIAAGPSSEAILTIDGNRVELGERSFIRIRPDGRAFYEEAWDDFWGGVQDISGRIWLKVDQVSEDRWEITAGESSGGPGVRG